MGRTCGTWGSEGALDHGKYMRITTIGFPQCLDGGSACSYSVLYRKPLPCDSTCERKLDLLLAGLHAKTLGLAR